AGVPVPPLVTALRAKLPEDAAHWLHWGATTQDVMDCALVLRLREALVLLSERLERMIPMLTDLAEAHVDTPMAGRTRTQIATPISFGLRAAYWLQGLLEVHEALRTLKAGCTKVQFGGASGANSAVAPHGALIGEALARELDLEAVPPWHTNRRLVPDTVGWCATASATAARIAGDVLILARREVAELRLVGGGGSSTMPNKANPVSTEVVVAVARYAATLTVPGTLSMQHLEDRDSTAWMLEWLALPQALICAGSALRNLGATLANMTPDPQAMARNLSLDGGATLAEAASFALARHMPRADAQAMVKTAATRSRVTGQALVDVLSEETGIPEFAEQVQLMARHGSGQEIVKQIVSSARLLRD
ncbi:MAG: lyase family protein, partial [Pseudomonadota bacterium]